MASFAFNFAVGGDDNGGTYTSDSVHAHELTASAPTPTQHTRRGERFHWQPTGDRAADFTRTLVPLGDGAAAPPPLAFELVNTANEAFEARTGAIRGILTTSDLQAGVYEGGFKLWECSLDLVKYVELLLAHGRNGDAAPSFRMPRKVMELGCGHGLPGIHALLRGAEMVTFMDYNKEVLELTTCPNVFRNAHGDASLLAKTSFYAGAWASVSELMEREEKQGDLDQTQYDLILTAETIYTEAVTVELNEMIKRHLRRDSTSMALVAAKKYYFGTGGSVQHFLDLVRREDVFRAEIVWEECDLRSNIREIVRVTYAAFA